MMFLILAKKSHNTSWKLRGVFFVVEIKVVEAATETALNAGITAAGMYGGLPGAILAAAVGGSEF